MAGFITKLIICPLTVIVSAYIFPNVEYAYLYQPVIVGLILAVAAHMMELFLLREETMWMSNVADIIAATLIVYIVSLFFAGAVVTIFGAILTAVLLGITEYFQHIWLIKSGRTQKSPA
jgi:hypothetical protein